MTTQALLAGGWWGGRVVNAEVPEQLGDVALDRMDVRSGRRPPWRRREQRDRARQVVDLAAQVGDAFRRQCGP